jgi:hypothetical protein
MAGSILRGCTEKKQTSQGLRWMFLELKWNRYCLKWMDYLIQFFTLKNNIFWIKAVKVFICCSNEALFWCYLELVAENLRNCFLLSSRCCLFLFFDLGLIRLYKGLCLSHIMILFFQKSFFLRTSGINCNWKAGVVLLIWHTKEVFGRGEFYNIQSKYFYVISLSFGEGFGEEKICFQTAGFQ